jgi:pimeloyl-ACP methyl ester carboxylesterase
MTSYHMALHPDSPVAALILVGLNASKSGTSVDSAADIRKINVPVLDIYGSEDLPGVIDSAPRRLKAARTGGNQEYSQVMVDGANHYFDQREDELLNHVSSWLEDIP